MIVTPAQVTLVTAAAATPVTLAQAKGHPRIDHSDEDTLITAMIEAATAHIENKTGRAMVERTYRADLWGFADEFYLPYPPMQSVTHVKYLDTSSPATLQTVAAADYTVDARAGKIHRTYGATWPTTYVAHNAVQITWVAGYAPTGSPQDYTAPVEDALRLAVMMTVADLYENREAGVIGQGFTPTVNKTVDWMLDQYRDFR